MTSINTIDDLIQVLDDHPEWLDALRARLLTPELLELPQTVARISERVDAFIEATNQQFEALRARIDALEIKVDALETKVDALGTKVDELGTRIDALEIKVDALETRMDALETKVDALETKVDALETKVDALGTKVDELGIRMDALETRMDSSETKIDALTAQSARHETAIAALRRDLGPLKGAHARNAALEEVPFIAHDLGLRHLKTLNRDELFELTQAGDTSDIPTNELRSFHRADLIAEAADPVGNRCYITAEVSFTANGRDTTRAIRNAAFLTRFTGQPARAVVAGLRHDERIQPTIASGDVAWYPLDAETLEAE